MSITITHQLIAETSLLGMGLDALGGLYLAYDLLGGESGPLRTIARATGYVTLFLIGYTIVIGLRYAILASIGMGVLLALEYRFIDQIKRTERSRRFGTLLFGFLRGVVLGIAGMTLFGVVFGILFGSLSGIGLMLVYYFDFSPTNDYEASTKPRVSTHKLTASFLRAVVVSIAGFVTGYATGTHALEIGIRLGIAAGVVSALVGLLSPIIEWWVVRLPERRLGVFGLGLIFLGMIFQSLQYWVVVFDVNVR